MAQYNNFSVSISKGKFYLKSKTPQDGYVEVKYGMDKDKITYHKYVDRVEGYINDVSISEVDYEGRKLRFLEVAFKEENGVVDKVSVSLMTNNGGYSQEARNLISCLKFADFSKRISLTPSLSNYTDKNGKPRTNLNIYGNYPEELGDNGKPISTGYIKYEDEPAPTQKTVAGQTVWDFSEKTEFYYQELNKIIEKFGSTTTTPPQQEKKATKVKKDEPVAVELDDLPF